MGAAPYGTGFAASQKNGTEPMCFFAGQHGFHAYEHVNIYHHTSTQFLNFSL